MKDAETSETRDAQLVRDLAAGDLAPMLAAIDSIKAGSGQRALSEPVLEALVRCVGDTRKSVQRRAIDALAAVASSGDARVVESLRKSVSGADRRARWAAAYALAQIGAKHLARDITDSVCEALSDDDGDIRWAAANLIVRLGREDPAAMGKRMLALASSADSNARKMALYCIRDLDVRGDDLLDVLGRLVRDPDVHVRLAALSVLARLENSGNSNDPAATLALQVLESDPDAGVRRAAAAALGNRKSATLRTASALRAAAGDKSDESLARAAQNALDRLEKR